MKRRSRAASAQYFKLQNYLVGDLIWKSDFSTIRNGICNQTYQRVAVKMISKQKIMNLPFGDYIFFSESVLAPVIFHPYIVPMREYIETDGQIFQILEYMPDGNLPMFMAEHELSNTQKIHIIDQILSAIEYLHKRRICHRDIKLENILMDGENIAKLSDFGFAAIMLDHVEGRFGSYGFAAPEIFMDQPYDGILADIWSAGMFIYSFFSNTNPFLETEDPDLIDPALIDYTDVPTEIVELCQCMLKKNPSDRMSISEIRMKPIFNCIERRVIPKEVENIDIPIEDFVILAEKRVAEYLKISIKQVEIFLKQFGKNIAKIIYILVKERLDFEGYLIPQQSQFISIPSWMSCPNSNLALNVSFFEPKNNSIKLIGDGSLISNTIDDYLKQKNFSVSTTINGNKNAVLSASNSELRILIETSHLQDDEWSVSITGDHAESQINDINQFLKSKYEAKKEDE